MLYMLLIGLSLFCAVILVLVILAQNSKGGGLSSQFGGSGASNLIGVKKTGDLLERLTWGFAIAIMVFALGSSKVVSNEAQEAANDAIMNKAKEQQQAPAPAPIDLLNQDDNSQASPIDSAGQ